ncbi:cysteine peptidase family C39 domain-containing protein, partial [Rhizobium lemnae]
MRVLFQSERSECGLVCLAMVASANGFDIDLSTLRSRFSISLKGSTLSDLIEIAAQRACRKHIRSSRLSPKHPHFHA